MDPRLLAEVSSLGHPPRVVAVFRAADLPKLEPAHAPPLGLALWRVQDPGNVGTLVRAAAAFGPAFVALSPGTADPLSPKALRASMGAIFRVPLGGFSPIPGEVVALVPHGGVPLASLSLPDQTTFLLGAEREGLPDDLLETCAEVASIPIAAASDSLNVAMAGTIALYEWSRARR